jgi:predicted MFS family arabinose efflux permease
VTQPVGSDKSLLLPTWAAADALGQITLLSLPFMLGMLVDNLRLGAGSAGLLLSVELCTISVVCMVISPFVGRLPKRTLALCGVALSLLGNALSVRYQDFAFLLTARVIAGAGYGLATAAGNAVVASANEPARLYDNKMMLFAVTQLVVDIGEPSLIGRFGPRGFFTAMIALTLIVTPLILRLPQNPQLSIATTPGSDPVKRDWVGKSAGLLVLAVAALFAVRESSYWGFVERFGAAASVSAELVGLLLAIGTLPSVIAPKLATLLRTRFGEIAPAVGGILLEGVVLVLVSETGSRSLFMFLLLIWPVFYCFTVPLLMGIAARLDKQGRVIALTAGALQIAFALGPALAGVLVQRAGLHALTPFAVGSTLLLAFLTLCMPRWELRHSRLVAPS